MSEESKEQRAFVLRIAPSGVDCFQEALESDELIIGWSAAHELIRDGLTWDEFRTILHEKYYASDSTMRRAGGAAGNMWRFIREMHPGDLVVVPHGPDFYVAQITGPAYHDASKVKPDTAFRRPVSWLNGRKPIPRKHARLGLKLRMNIQNTCAGADDIKDDILYALSKSGRTTFQQDLKRSMVDGVLHELHHGKIDDRGFENLIAALLRKIGATHVKVIPRNLDKGADVTGVISIANTFEFLLAIQAKHYRPYPPVGVEVVDQLVKGMQAEAADLGWIVTSGTFSDQVQQYVKSLHEDQDIRIDLIDGEQFATLIVENGLIDNPEI